MWGNPERKVRNKLFLLSQPRTVRESYCVPEAVPELGSCPLLLATMPIVETRKLGLHQVPGLPHTCEWLSRVARPLPGTEALALVLSAWLLPSRQCPGRGVAGPGTSWSQRAALAQKTKARWLACHSHSRGSWQHRSEQSHSRRDSASQQPTSLLPPTSALETEPCQGHGLRSDGGYRWRDLAGWESWGRRGLCCDICHPFELIEKIRLTGGAPFLCPPI